MALTFLGGPRLENFEDFCKGKKSSNYPDPASCGGFIHCSNGFTYKMECPVNLWYNPKTDGCDYPKNVECKFKGRYFHHLCRLRQQHKNFLFSYSNRPQK